jgi:hypothetical protein
MSRRAWFGGFGAGVLAGAVGTLWLAGGEELPRARAQAPQEASLSPGAPGRYQVSSWAQTGSPGMPPAFGAYVLDTQTGQLWISRDGEGLKPAGRGNRAQD